jgi:hypothetical protein
MGNLQDVLEGAQSGLVNTLALEPGGNGSASEVVEDTNNGGMDLDLVKESEEALRLQKKLDSIRLDRSQTSVIVDQAMDKLEFLERERDALEEKITQDEKSLQSLQQYDQLLAGSGKNKQKRAILKRALPKLRQQPTDSGVGARLEGAFVSRALNTIDRRTTYAEECAEKAEKNRRDFRAVSDRLGKDFQIRVLENPESDDTAARVTGRFEPGVQVFMELRMEDQSTQPEGSIVSTPDGDEIRAYIRANRGGAKFRSR